MSPDEQRIAIAEACGWGWFKLDPWAYQARNYRYLIHPSLWMEEVSLPPIADMSEPICAWGYLWREGRVPDYLNDLNAMHEAENVLTVSQRMDYARLVFHLAGAPNVPERTWDEIFDACHVGAGIKAEAFLKVLGKLAARAATKGQP